MNANGYQALAARTECDQYAARGRFSYSIETVRLNHAVLGLAGEVGELACAIEKWVHYGQSLDETNVKEELGDILWYVALACNALGIPMLGVMEANIAKLKNRYPEKYSDQQAEEGNRDRGEERKAVEGNDDKKPHLNGEAWS